MSGAARAALAAAPNLIETILTGGDDYELVFCAPRAVAPRLEVLASETDVPITAIGAIQAGEKVAVFDAAGSGTSFECATKAKFTGANSGTSTALRMVSQDINLAAACNTLTGFSHSVGLGCNETGLVT